MRKQLGVGYKYSNRDFSISKTQASNLNTADPPRREAEKKRTEAIQAMQSTSTTQAASSAQATSPMQPTSPTQTTTSIDTQRNNQTEESNQPEENNQPKVNNQPEECSQPEDSSRIERSNQRSAYVLMYRKHSGPPPSISEGKPAKLFATQEEARLAIDGKRNNVLKTHGIGSVIDVEHKYRLKYTDPKTTIEK
jgi:hypothetical protein